MSQLAAILLVDDDPSTNFLNEATLYPLRLTDTILTARNGVEAIDLLKKQQSIATAESPILVLLDMAMPVMNGMDFLRAFRELPASLRASTVIIILAVSMPSADLARLDEFPIAGMVSKPLTAEKVETILQLHFNGLGQ